MILIKLLRIHDLLIVKTELDYIYTICNTVLSLQLHTTMLHNNTRVASDFVTKLEYAIANDIQRFIKVSIFTKLKNFTIMLSVFMVVDSQI